MGSVHKNVKGLFIQPSSPQARSVTHISDQFVHYVFFSNFLLSMAGKISNFNCVGQEGRLEKRFYCMFSLVNQLRHKIDTSSRS